MYIYVIILQDNTQKRKKDITVQIILLILDAQILKDFETIDKTVTCFNCNIRSGARKRTKTPTTFLSR
jgi:hypothetical protein